MNYLFVGMNVCMCVSLCLSLCLGVSVYLSASDMYLSASDMYLYFSMPLCVCACMPAHMFAVLCLPDVLLVFHTHMLLEIPPVSFMFSTNLISPLNLTCK